MRVTLKQVKKVWADFEALVTLECEPDLPAYRRWRVCDSETFSRGPWQDYDGARKARMRAIQQSVIHQLWFDTDMTLDEAEAWVDLRLSGKQRRVCGPLSKRERQRMTWLLTNDRLSTHVRDIAGRLAHFF